MTPSPSPAELAAVLDHHWLAQRIETGVAYCTCGTWSFDARSGQHPLPTLGERFAPFSEHVADVILAMPDHLLVHKDEWERLQAIEQAAGRYFIAVHRSAGVSNAYAALYDAISAEAHVHE